MINLFIGKLAGGAISEYTTMNILSSFAGIAVLQDSLGWFDFQFS